MGDGGRFDGKYTPHGAKEPCSYQVTWSVRADTIRWKAVVERDGVFVGAPRGAFNARLPDGSKPETWVRAAVELAIEQAIRLG